MLKYKIHLASCYLIIPIVFLLFPSFPTLLSAGGEQIVFFLEIDIYKGTACFRDYFELMAL